MTSMAMGLAAVLSLAMMFSSANGQNACLAEASTCSPGRSSVDVQNCGISDADIPDLQSCFTAVGRSGISYVNLASNELSTVPLDLLEGMEALTLLIFRDNQITSIEGPLPSSVTTLSLDSNQITSIGEGILPAGLRSMSLSENPITAIDDIAFPSSSMTSLYLSLTRITSIAEDAFPASLTAIYFLNNPVTFIAENAFPSSLTYLNLRGMNLGTLAATSFDNLGSLRRLQMSNNSIETIEPGAFKNLSSLERLDLQNNPLETLPSNLFAAMGQLEILDLSDNQLAKLPVDAFAGLSSLREILLDNNALTTLPAGIFKDLGSGEGGSLWLLNLEDNPGLQCVPEVYLIGVGYDDSGDINNLYRVDLPTTPGMCECTPADAINCAVGATCIPGEEGYTCLEEPSSECSNGIPGIDGSNDNGEVCCPIACNQCGGAGCGTSGAADGLSNAECCINGILGAQGFCSVTGAAPCINDNPVSLCSNGIPGIGGSNDNGEVCCPIACNQCGGAGCGTSGAADGLSNAECCINGILGAQDFCSESGTAPCVL